MPRSNFRKSLGAATPLLAAVVIGCALILVGTCRRAEPHVWVLVSSEDSGDVSVIDPRTDQVVRTIAVGKRPRGLRMSADGHRAFFAQELRAKLSYAWWVQRRGFVRNTLGAGLCDVLMAVPSDFEKVTTTKPYFRSTFAIVSARRSALDDLRSTDDPRLAKLRIAVPLAGDGGANPAPIHALSRRGIVDDERGFSLFGEYDAYLYTLE